MHHVHLEDNLRAEIAALMEEHKVSVYRIAKDSNGKVFSATITRWLNGKNSITLKKFSAILQGLGLTCLTVRPRGYNDGYRDACKASIRAIDDGFSVKTNIRHSYEVTTGKKWKDG